MWWPPRACCIIAHSLTVILKRDFADLRQKFGTKSYQIVAMSGTRVLAIKSSSLLVWQCIPSCMKYSVSHLYESGGLVSLFNHCWKASVRKGEGRNVDIFEKNINKNSFNGRFSLLTMTVLIAWYIIALYRLLGAYPTKSNEIEKGSVQ